MIKPKETFHFKPPTQIIGNWMIGLTDLEVYNSLFDITEQNIKLQLYKFPNEKSGGISYTNSRDDIARDLGFSDITAADIEDDIIAPNIIEEQREQVAKRMKDVGFMNIVTGYVSSVFQNFESYLRTEVDLAKDDIKLVLENIIQVSLLMKCNQIITLLKIFPKFFSISFNLNIQGLVT